MLRFARFFDVPRKRNRRPRLNLAEYGGLGVGLLHKTPALVHIRTNIATEKDRNYSIFLLGSVILYLQYFEFLK